MYILNLIGKVSLGLVICYVLFAVTSMLAFMVWAPVELIFNDQNPVTHPFINWKWYYLISVPATTYFIYLVKSNKI